MGQCGDMRPCSFSAPKGTCCQVIMRAVVEFLGTFVLVHAVCLAVNQGSLVPPFVAGLALMVLVYTFGHISGGHFNPCVSTCQWIAGQITFLTWAIFITVQITGGILGGIIAAYIADIGGFPVFSAENHEEGLWVEFLFTFLLCTTVANTAATTFVGYEDNSFFGFAIGMVVAVGGFMSKNTSGRSSSGAFNPAVLLGCNIGAVLFDDRNLATVTIPSAAAKYWVAFLGMEFLGAIFAGLFFLLTENTVVESGKDKYSDDEHDGTTDGTDDYRNKSDDYDKPTPGGYGKPEGYGIEPQPNGYGNQPQPNGYGRPQPSGNYGNQPQPRGYSEQPAVPQGYMTTQTIEMASH